MVGYGYTMVVDIDSIWVEDLWAWVGVATTHIVLITMR